MKAIVMHAPGDPSVLQYEEVPTPVPNEGEVLVKAAMIGVNRPELAVRRGTYGWMPPLPAIPGIEMSGTVVATGPNVDDVPIGSKAFVTARDLPVRAGCYAEYISVPRHALRLLPDQAELQAAACLSSYQMAYYLLHVASRGITGNSALIDIASGGIGSALVQLAKIHGMKPVVAVVGSAEKAAALEAFGADLALLPDDPGFAEKVRAITGGRGIDLILNGMGGDAFAQQMSLIAPLGLAVAYGAMSGQVDLPIGPIGYDNHLGNQCGAIRLFNVHLFDDWPEYRQQSIDYVIDRLARGEIKPLIHEVVPLAEAAKAHEILEARAAIGKILLKP